MQLTVALLQMMSCGNDQSANLSKGETFCRRARDMGADIALFPEMWNIGYTSYLPKEQDVCDLWRAPERWKNGAISTDPALQSAREQWQTQAISQDDHFITHYPFIRFDDKGEAYERTRR